MKKRTTILLLFFVGLLSAQNNLLIKNGTLLTVTDGVKEDTDLLIINGKIKSIGKNLKAPSNVEVIDAAGQYVMPGIIDAHSHIALDNVNEYVATLSSGVFTGDVINPYDVSIYRALAGGVTAAHLMHGSANAIGGECETIKLRYGSWDSEDLVMKGAPRTIKFALGENPMRVHGEGRGLSPATRMGVEQFFRDKFEKALEYKKNWADFKSGKTKIPPSVSKRLQTLVDILDGKVIIHCHSYRADEILMLMRVLKDYGVNRITFQHVNEGFKVAKELAEFGATASVFSDWWAYKFEVYYSTAYNAAILTKNGVVTSINSDDPELITHLYHEAAKTQRYGNLSDEEALKLITINPAIQLGIDNRVGSLEVGKDGDIAIFNQHPLSIYAIPQKTIIDGKVLFDINDPQNDKRIDVNPEESIDASYIEEEEHDGCLHGVELEESHSHNH